MLIRSVGSVLRGKATPLQLSLAAVLGALVGFVPSWSQSPGLVAVLLVLLIVMNANLVLAALVGAAAKLASLALMPVSFEVGRVLLDGPPQPVFRRLINAPGTALFGLEYYATAGGLVIGLLLGAICAFAVVRGVSAFRRRMSALEEGSESYQRWASKPAVRVLSFLLLGGGRGKATYKDLLSKRAGLPIRPLGVVFVVLIAALGALVMAFAGEPITTALVRNGLERANGATVDLASATLDWRAGKLRLTNVAAADPDALETDRVRARAAEADISTADLLRKRIALDRVVLSEASTGERRDTRGRLTRARPPAPPPPAPSGPSGGTLDDYIQEAKVWRERLGKLRECLEKLDRQRPEPSEGPADEEGGESLRERLERAVRERGYARVAASHLIEGSPTVLVRELVVEGLRAPDLGGPLLDVRAENLSTHPWLVQEPPRVVVESRGGEFKAEVAAGALAGGGGDGTLRFSYSGLPADSAAEQLKVSGERPIKGGTVDLAADGRFSGGTVDLPLRITVRDTVVTMAGAGSAPVKELTLPVGVSGSIGDPRISVDQKALADALAKAGASELAARARGEVDKLVDKARDEAVKKLGEETKDTLGGLLDGLKGRDKDKR